MKKYLTTGLAILLPIILTIMILNFFINFLTRPFLEPTKALVTHFNLFHQPFFLFNEMTLVTLTSKILILGSLVAFIFMIGFLGKLFLMDYLLRLGNYFFLHVPFVNKIYKTCQDAVFSLFSSSNTFSQVVLVPFPHANNLSVGLVIQESINLRQANVEIKNFVSVFVPSAPNPTVGFLLLFKREHLTFVNMKVDEAMKFVVSCSVLMPDFAIPQPNVSYETYFSSESHFSPREG